MARTNRTVPDALARIVREVSDTARRDDATGSVLLERFVATRDEDAFRALVQLYAPMVWSICRRALRNAEDAEDAFQASFLVLARKASRIHPREKLPTWLYGVAVRCGRAVLATKARRKEVAVAEFPERSVEPDSPCLDVYRVLDEEIRRLPDDLRRAVVLCRFEDRTYAEAARVLECSISTVSDRLGRAEKLLKKRLGARGLAPAGAVLGWLASGTGNASVPAPLAERTTQGILGLSSLGPTATAVNAADVVVRGMALRMIRRGLGLVLLVMIGAGIGASYGVESVPESVVTQSAAPSRVDRLGDPLPDGAVARIGTVRFRAARFGYGEDVAFLPGREELASAHGRDEVIFWDQKTGKPRRVLEGPPGAQWVAVSSRGPMLVVAGATDVWAWDIGTAEPRLRWKRTCSGLPQASLSALAVSSDGTAVATGDPAGQTWVLDAQTGEPVAMLDGHPWGLAFVSGNRLAVSTGSDGEADRVDIWDLKSKRVESTIRAPKGESIDDLTASPEGRSLAWLGSRFAVRVADPTNGQEVRSWPRNPFGGGGVFFLPDGKTVAEAGFWSVRFHDLATGRELRPPVPTPGLAVHAYIPHHAGKRVSADGKLMATACLGQVMVWNLETGQPVGPDGQILGAIRRLSFSPDGRTLATFADRSSTARLWDTHTGEPGPTIGQRATATDVVRTVGWDGRGRALTVSHNAAEVYLEAWDRPTGKLAERSILSPDIQALATSSNGLIAFDTSPLGAVAIGSNEDFVVRDDSGHERRVSTRRPVMRVVLSGDARTVLTSGWADQHDARTLLAEVWDVETRKARAVRLSGREWATNFFATALSADGRWVAAPLRDHTIVLVETFTGKSGQRFSCDAAPISTAFSPDGRLLAAGDERGRVSVWNLATRKTHRTYSGHDGGVCVVAFSPDGRRLASGGEDGTALIWDVGTASLDIESHSVKALTHDAATAHQAAFALTVKNDVGALTELVLNSASCPQPATVRSWLSDLSSPDTATRNAAEVSLIAAGNGVRVEIRRALAASPSTEARARMNWLLTRLDSPTLTQNVVAVRVIAVLEAMGSLEAKRVLSDFARQFADSPIATEAEAASRRLAVKAK